jgi:hypothetical protein
MDEEEVKELVANALELSADDCEIYVKPRGILLSFLSGARFFLPQPLDLNENEDDVEEEED